MAESQSSYAEVKAEKTSHNEFVIKNGNPEATGFERSRGISVRVLVDGALGFASTNTLERSNVRMIVDEACRMAKSSSRFTKEPISFSSEQMHKDASYKVSQKENLSDIAPEDKLSLLLGLNSGIPDSLTLAGMFLELYDTQTEKTYMNSEGSSIRSFVPRVGFFGFLTLLHEGETAQAMLQKGAASGWEAIKQWDMDSYIEKELTTLQSMLVNGKACPAGAMDVICGPEVTGIASHESCGHPYEADRILGREAAQAGESFVTTDMLGTRIGSELVTLVDDPTLPNSYGFYLYDDEGVEARKRYLIKDGMINDLLHNRETAGRLGISSNGSARCNAYNREPIVRMANTFVEEGEWGRDEVIEETKRGILINSFTEWNIDDRRYNQRYVSREAYYIENGEIQYPVRKAILEVTTPTFWSSVDAVADDTEFFSGSCGKGEPMQGIPVYMGGPSMRLHNIRMGV